MKKLVIFDLDGTILNTLTDITNSVNYVLDFYSFKLRTEEEIKYFLGNGPRYLLEKSFNKKFEGQEYEDVFELYDNFYDKQKTNNTKPYEGIEEVLKDLKNEGYLLAVCSNKQDTATTKIIEELFPNIFDVVMGTSPKFLRKPSPEMVLEILRILKIKKENTIYIGDTEIDLKTAINANIKKIAVLYGFRKKSDLISYNPEYFVKETKEIIKIVKKEL